MYKTLIVIDENSPVGDELPGVINFNTYLKDYPKRNEPKTRIINLCDSQAYLSKGYYCSLLAEARSHKVVPSVKTLNALRNQPAGQPFLTMAQESKLMAELANQETIYAFFGKVSSPELQKLVSRVYAQLQTPLLKLTLQPNAGRLSIYVAQLCLSDLPHDQLAVFSEHLKEFSESIWKVQAKKKQARWDMAILVNPEESVPPSDKAAITHMIRAAAKHGIHAEALSIEQISNIGHFDALFIRETTAIDHHTYRLAVQAENQGLVVIDDSQSILRCCNKVFLHDAFSYHQVPSLKTEVVTDAEATTLDVIEDNFSYPVVLKMPEGSFSRGVFKVADRNALREKLQLLLADSALVLAQEYLYTDFDWRIGVLGGRAIFACRYKMARNHWQIYNHGAKRNVSGDFETLPTFEVPKIVLDAALKSCSIIGNGLYGVDIKEHKGKAYVIEVNDNPSLDRGVEDLYLGDELYMQIMGEFQRRLENRGR
ncbi:RimK family protein [Reinekea marina]|uniref:RimK family protein n=1 Tax=Reinekea marina TaxID=1310421 RepID=A0ABV7WUD6_9GAMM|nr:RimK family protein [Reinekea marina]MBU2863794.1 RimK family protein [Reinekea forsetii]MDN3650871.1 RimK family protein [Reinekea marina]